MAAFTSVPPFTGVTPEPQMTRPALNLTRYCQTPNCRNAIRRSSEDKLCAQCLASSGPDSFKDAVEEGELSAEPPRAASNDPQRPMCEYRESRDVQPARPSSSHVAVETQVDPHAAQLAMLDERQQNRARKLERETEEVDGRWRTMQSATTLLGGSPPPLSHARRSEHDHGLIADTHRPSGLVRPREIDAYRPDDAVRSREIDSYRPDRSPRSSVKILGSSQIDRLYEMNPLRAPGLASKPTINVPLGPSNKRKLETSSAAFARNATSNKTLGNPSQVIRCGKRNCNNVALSGKDRCISCYNAEGRHSGDERRRCASSGCTHCISDAITGDLCRVCLGIELGQIKQKQCIRPFCTNTQRIGTPGSLCGSCHRQSAPVRRCQRYTCNAVLQSGDRGSHCKLHTLAPSRRRCRMPSCNNQIAANASGELCNSCQTAKRTQKKTSTEPPPVVTPSHGNLTAPGGLARYANYPYLVPYSYHPLQQFQDPPYQQGFEPYSHSFQLQAPDGQSQPFPVQPQQFQYPAQHLVMGQQPSLQQRPSQLFSYRSQHIDRPQQIDGRHSSFLTQNFPAQEVCSQVSDLALCRRPTQLVRPQLRLDESPLTHGLPIGTQPLSNVSSSARRLRVATMQRMLEAPCSGCLEKLSAEEAATHPQIYCVHLTSAVRQTVLLDHEQWKELCAAGQEGEAYSNDDASERSGNELVMKQDAPERSENELIMKQEEQEEKLLGPGSELTQNPQSNPLLPSTQLQRPVGSPVSTRAESEQENSTRGSVAPESHPHLSPPANSTQTVVDRSPKPDDAANPTQRASSATGGTLPRTWAVESVRELLELKNAVEPGTPLEVAVSLQQELRNCLLVDVTEGDPQDGEPAAIGLLRVLDQEVESLQARPTDA